MDELTTTSDRDFEPEILPPEHVSAGETATCACCCRPRPRSTMDEDGCGICDECLAP